MGRDILHSIKNSHTHIQKAMLHVEILVAFSSRNDKDVWPAAATTLQGTKRRGRQGKKMTDIQLGKEGITHSFKLIHTLMFTHKSTYAHIVTHIYIHTHNLTHIHIYSHTYT